MLNAYDVFAVKFALNCKLRHTCDMYTVQSAQPLSHVCMKGAGFEISRLAIDKYS